MHTSEWRVEPGNMATWTKVMRGSEKDGDLEIVAKTYAIEGGTATDVANLIAAAPELVSLLRECSTALADLLADADPSGLECQEQWACVAECKKAIAKAEGRSE